MQTLYEWDRWFRKKHFRLRPGLDYTCSPLSMAQQIRNAASKRGLRIDINILSDFGLYVVITGTKTCRRSRKAS